VKPVLAWVKSNLIIVIALALAIIAIPVALIFSSKMSAKLRSAVQSDVTSVMGQLNGLAVDYSIPAATPAEQPWSLRRAPNQLLNTQVEEVLKRLTAESEQARQIAIDRNSAGKSLIIAGKTPETTLFPSPANESARVRLLTDMAEKWPAANAQLLADRRAGMPPNPEELYAMLEARFERLKHERVSGRVSQDLDAEEKQEIASQLADERLEAYRKQAQRITFYADPAVFRNVEPWSAARGVPRIEQAWEWQWIYWINQDIVDALAKANSAPGVPWVPVPNAPVKRVLSINVKPFGATSTGGESDVDLNSRGRGESEDSGEAGAAAPDPNAPITPDYSVAPTGRAGWPAVPNGLFDVRYATIEIIVDVNRLPAVLNAIATTNLMSVIDLDVRSYQNPSDIDQGFYFGPDTLVVATIGVESIWIRSWMVPWMPEPVRTRLGIPPDQPATTEETPSES